MKKMSTYLLVMIMGLFWIFRIIVAITDSMGISIGFSMPNVTVEVILLFVTIFLIILVYKRRIIGILGYLFMQLAYFGPSLVTNMMTITSSEDVPALAYSDTLAAVLAIGIAFAVLIDYLLDKNRQNHPKDKKTDWFYQNEEYDRKRDDRDDKNQYRTL